MQFDYPHAVDHEEAIQRLERLGSYLTNRHNIRVEWRDHECTINGNYLMIKIEGKMSISPSNIHFDGRDPGMLWRKKAIKYLQEKLEMYLDLNTPIDELPIDKV